MVSDVPGETEMGCGEAGMNGKNELCVMGVSARGTGALCGVVWVHEIRFGALCGRTGCMGNGELYDII